MGIIVFVVLLGYLAVGAMAMLGAMALFPRKGLAAFVTFLLLLSPLWYVLASKALFAYECARPGVGITIDEPIHASSFIHKHDVYLDKLRPGADGTPTCDSLCGNDLNSYFHAARSWAVVRNGISVETSWQRVPRDKVERRARYWVAPAGSPNCLVPLSPAYYMEKPDKCIAGYFIGKFSAIYEFVENPFVKCVDEHTCFNRSQAWEFLGVQRFENHFKKGDKVVAKVVAYYRKTLLVVDAPATCPFEPRAHGTWTRHLFNAVFPSPNPGVQPAPARGRG